MVSAWYMDDSDEDQRLEHHKNPAQPVDMKDLFALSGVLHWKVCRFTVVKVFSLKMYRFDNIIS